MSDDRPPHPRSPVGQAQISLRAEALLSAWRRDSDERRLQRLEELLAYDIAKRELLGQRLRWPDAGRTAD